MNISSPIYITGVSLSTGQIMLGGIFKLHDQIGFPVDCSIEICEDHNYLIDYCEALCDCWLNDCLKFDSFVRQIESRCSMLIEHRWKIACSLVLEQFPKMQMTINPIDTVCRYILTKKEKTIHPIKSQ